MRARLACLGLCALLSACASTARLTGDFGEYQSYRQTRIAATLEERLGASDRYLREFPHGDYEREVRGWFAPAEGRYFRLSWDNPQRLRAYLDVMPKGPHAADVADRITQLDSRRIFAERREKRMLEKARAFEAALAEAAAQRRALLLEFSTWTRLLGSTRAFGRPTSALDSELSSRFYAGPAPGTCAGDLCSKSFALPYAVPADKELSLRTLDVKFEIRLEWGQVREVTLSAPELLTHVAEAVEVRGIAANDSQARAEAVGHALGVVAEALDMPLPLSRCNVSAVAPVLLARRCQGVHLEVVAATDTGAVDRISIAAVRR